MKDPVFTYPKPIKRGVLGGFSSIPHQFLTVLRGFLFFWGLFLLHRFANVWMLPPPSFLTHLNGFDWWASLQKKETVLRTLGNFMAL